MNASQPKVTPERFASGMTYTQYLDYIVTPENLQREGSDGGVRIDRLPEIRDWYDSFRLADHQVEALRILAANPNGPRKLLVIAEEWSSDCRRDLPVLARMAEAAGLEMSIFTRDGARFSGAPSPSPEESPNADLMIQFLNQKHGATFQSIPVAAFFTADMTYLYHYTEYPAIYDKDRIVQAHIRGPRPGETPEQTRTRAGREFGDLVQSPFWRIWACAAVDEMISALHRRLVLGQL